jgi:hypothetical protein
MPGGVPETRLDDLYRLSRKSRRPSTAMRASNAKPRRGRGRAGFQKTRLDDWYPLSRKSRRPSTAMRPAPIECSLFTVADIATARVSPGGRSPGEPTVGIGPPGGMARALGARWTCRPGADAVAWRAASHRVGSRGVSCGMPVKRWSGSLHMVAHGCADEVKNRVQVTSY